MKIEYSATAVKELKKLDKHVQKQILTYMLEVSILDNPRSRGKMLSENLAGLWRYRIGDYRVICEINDERILITILHVAHRKEVYK